MIDSAPDDKIMLEFSKPQMNPRDYLDQFDFFAMSQAMAKEISSLRGLIRRLEKSNEELGLELHRCQHPEIKGWD